MPLTWSYHKDLLTRIAELDKANPSATAQQIADTLAAERPELAADLTANAVQKQRKALRNQDGQTLVGIYNAIFRGKREDADGEAAAPALALLPPSLTPPADLGPLHYWDGGSLSAVVRQEAGERIVAIVGDTQFPHEDKVAWALFLAWVRDVRPDQIVVSGDGVDFAKVSRWGAKAGRDLIGGMNVDLAYAYHRFRELREAAGPDARIRYCRGNHDDNLERMLIRLGQADLTQLRPAGDATEPPLLSLRRMLRLDELNIEISDTPWPHDRVILAPDLVVFHGESSRKGAGQSVRTLMAKFPTASTAQGHCHRQAIIGEAIQGIDGSYGIRYGIETGMLCAPDGLGYTVAPDWQMGWAVVSFAPDGAWSPELVTVRNATASWRGRRWTHDEVEELLAA